MNPNDSEFQKLQTQVAEMQRVIDGLQSQNEMSPEIVRSIKLVANGVERGELGDGSDLLRAVDEGGVATYDVAKGFDGSIIVTDSQGNDYKLGYYTP